MISFDNHRLYIICLPLHSNMSLLVTICHQNHGYFAMKNNKWPYYNIQMGGLCNGQSDSQHIKQPVPKNHDIQKVDQVKYKLKKARDNIKTFLNSKNRDLSQIQHRIAEKVPSFKATGNKKQLIPLLKAKKDLLNMIQSGQVRLKLVNDKLNEVQMQNINAETIDVLEQSNRYVREIQQQLQHKDWRSILDEAQQKYEIAWPEQQSRQADPAFQKMWQELGGDKLAGVVNQNRPIVNKTVDVVFTNGSQRVSYPQKVQYARVQ